MPNPKPQPPPHPNLSPSPSPNPDPNPSLDPDPILTLTDLHPHRPSPSPTLTLTDLQREADDRVAIGIIPAGSGNTWAFDLGLEDAVDAARVVAAGETVAVDVMAISSIGEPERVREYALNIAGFAHAHAHAHTMHTAVHATCMPCPCHAHAMHIPCTSAHAPHAIAGFGMPAAVLTQANALRWLGSAQYELAGLLLILNGQTRYGATLTIEQARCAPLIPAASL